jgi:type IV secretory pathway VirB3-like protein
VILGISIAISGLQGIVAIFVYIISSFSIAYIYVTRILQPEEDLIETIDIFKEHWMMGFFCFLLPWIITFNLIKY